MISCLLITGDPSRFELLKQSVRSFRRQTHVNRELVICSDGPRDYGEKLLLYIDSLGDARIRLEISTQKLSLGAIRNVSVGCADGTFVCQWDDDDLYDPLRLEVQLQTIYSTKAQASVLARWMIWWPNLNKLSISCYRDWEGSLLWERSLMPRYPDNDKGEDSIGMEKLRQSIRIVRIDMPRLYIYIIHGANTFEPEHFNHHWKESTYRWEDNDTLCIEQELNRRIPIIKYGKLVDANGPLTSIHNQKTTKTYPEKPKDPKVLILTPIRDATNHIYRYMSLLERINYDKERLSIALLEGDSNDKTFSELNKLRPQFEQRFRRVDVIRKHFYPPTRTEPKWQTSIQRERRERLAKIRNYLLMAALRDEDWVLWLDVDVCDYPADLIHQLIESGRDIVTANCLGPTGSAYDLNSFRKKPSLPRQVKAAFTSTNHMRRTSEDDQLIDGLWQPPKGFGRDYVDAFRSHSLIELDAIGGTVLMVRAELHRQGLNFPAFPVEGLIETEGFSIVARKMGIRSWALPQLLVHHS